MKKIRVTKSVQIILITLFLIVVGAIMVGVVSNNKVNGFSCTKEGCNSSQGFAPLYQMSDDNAHYYMCVDCGTKISQAHSNVSKARRLDDTYHGWYYKCSICGYASEVNYERGMHSYDSNGNCTMASFGCEATGTPSGGGTGGDGTGGGGSTEGLIYDWFDLSIHHIYKDGDWYSYENHTSSSWEDQGDGTHWALCSKCNGAARLEHNEVTIPAVAATCTKAGKTAGKKCSDCGAITQAQKDIPAGHTEVDIGENIEATCTTEGSKGGKKCSACGEITQQPTIIPAKGHNYYDGTCTQCGEKEPITEIEIVSTKYKIDGGYILDIQPGTKIINLITNITTNAIEINVYNNDEKMKDDTMVATGMTIELKNGELRKTFTIIVKGDVNCDGVADFKDLVKINKARLNKITLEEIYLRAADVNEDESLDLKDLSKINRYRLYKITEL